MILRFLGNRYEILQLRILYRLVEQHEDEEYYGGSRRARKGDEAV